MTIQRRWRTTPRGKRSFYDYLVVSNTGQAVARDVHLESLESRPTGDDPVVTNKDTIFPVRELPAGTPITTLVRLYGGMGDHFEAVVSREDGRGRQRVSRTVTISR